MTSIIISKKSGPKLATSILLATLLLFSCGHADELSPFTSDGCSAFPDGTFAMRNLWLSCCTAHDLAYWRGGNYEERLQADKALSQCVAQVGEKEIAKIMLAGVRVGGTPFLPTTFRWGYGWPYLRGYKSLTAEELRLVEAQLKDHQTQDTLEDNQ